MHEGQLVVVMGKLDERVRQARAQNGLVVGTIYFIPRKDHVWVLLADGTFWMGPIRDIAPFEDQKPPEPVLSVI